MAIHYAVCGHPKIKPEETLVLRRFDTEDDALNHALAVNMDHWDDVWVRKVDAVFPHPDDLVAPTPWTTEFAHTFCYIRDANGKRALSVFGCPERRQKILDALEQAELLSGENQSAQPIKVA